MGNTALQASNVVINGVGYYFELEQFKRNNVDYVNVYLCSGEEINIPINLFSVLSDSIKDFCGLPKTGIP